jgi:hypothetical protein
MTSSDDDSERLRLLVEGSEISDGLEKNAGAELPA